MVASRSSGAVISRSGVLASSPVADRTEPNNAVTRDQTGSSSSRTADDRSLNAIMLSHHAASSCSRGGESSTTSSVSPAHVEAFALWATI